jgi:predicted porin
MASYQRQDQSHSVRLNPITKAWILGANYTMGPGKVLAGYGQKSPDGLAKVRQASLGYEYSLSKRTYLYADLSNKRGLPITATAPSSSVNTYSLGVNHAF